MDCKKWRKCSSAHDRVINAKAGMEVCWSSTSFRVGVIASILTWVLAAAVGCSINRLGVLALALACANAVEMLNTALELVVDRVGLEWNALSRDAKDVAAAASMLVYTIAFVLGAVFILISIIQ